MPFPKAPPPTRTTPPENLSLRGAQRRGNPSSSLRRTFKKTCHCEPVRTLVRQSVLPMRGTILPCIRRGRPPDDPPDTRHTPCRMGITDSHVAALLVMTVHEKRPVMRRGGVLPRPLALHWQKPVSLRTSAHAGVAIRAPSRTASHKGNGLPRRFAPRNDIF